MNFTGKLITYVVWFKTQDLSNWFIIGRDIEVKIPFLEP